MILSIHCVCSTMCHVSSSFDFIRGAYAVNSYSDMENMPTKTNNEISHSFPFFISDDYFMAFKSFNVQP